MYTAEGQHVSQSDLDETVNILNLRVNGLGVSGAQVQATGKNQISVSIPGVTNAQQVLAPDRADGADVLPPGAVLRRSPRPAQGLDDQAAADRASRPFQPAARTSQLTAGQPRRHTRQRLSPTSSPPTTCRPT